MWVKNIFGPRLAKLSQQAVNPQLHVHHRVPGRTMNRICLLSRPAAHRRTGIDTRRGAEQVLVPERFRIIRNPRHRCQDPL
jgi:hypothetical protein